MANDTPNEVPIGVYRAASGDRRSTPIIQRDIQSGVIPGSYCPERPATMGRFFVDLIAWKRANAKGSKKARAGIDRELLESELRTR